MDRWPCGGLSQFDSIRCLIFDFSSKVGRHFWASLTSRLGSRITSCTQYLRSSSTPSLEHFHETRFPLAPCCTLPSLLNAPLLAPLQSTSTIGSRSCDVELALQSSTGRLMRRERSRPQAVVCVRDFRLTALREGERIRRQRRRLTSHKAVFTHMGDLLQLCLPWSAECHSRMKKSRVSCYFGEEEKLTVLHRYVEEAHV